MSEQTLGSYSFDEVGPGFVAFRIEADNDLFKDYLVELKLAEIKRVFRGRASYGWTCEFMMFLAHNGYTSAVDVVANMRKDGLVMRRDQAILFRLQFL